MTEFRWRPGQRGDWLGGVEAAVEQVGGVDELKGVVPGGGCAGVPVSVVSGGWCSVSGSRVGPGAGF